MNPDIEWDIDGLAEILGDDEVSNLLSSPASGETPLTPTHCCRRIRFQFIEFPSEWGGKFLRSSGSTN